MERILVLGGGVGGTLSANLLARRLRRRIDAGELEVTLVDEGGEHVYQPGFMYLAMGTERPERLHRPERSLLDQPRRHRLEHAHGGPVEQNLMFAGHAAFRFKTDPFYSNGFVPTVKQLVDRILTGA